MLIDDHGLNVSVKVILDDGDFTGMTISLWYWYFGHWNNPSLVNEVLSVSNKFTSRLDLLPSGITDLFVHHLQFRQIQASLMGTTHSDRCAWLEWVAHLSL